MSLMLVSYAVTENLYNLQLRMQSTVKQGLLGNVPVCVVLDKGVVCPGNSATFHIVIDLLPNSSSNGEDTLSVDEATESADALLLDSSTSGMLHSCEHCGRQLLRKQSPAHNQHSQPSGAWGYKVRATLIQHTRYIFERSHTPGRYSFRDSKNVTHAHLPSILIPAQATSGTGTHLTLALRIPSQLQYQVRTSELAISYSLRLEFFPRLSARWMPTQLTRNTLVRNRGYVLFGFPVIVPPDSLSKLMGNPPVGKFLYFFAVE